MLAGQARFNAAGRKFPQVARLRECVAHGSATPISVPLLARPCSLCSCVRLQISSLPSERRSFCKKEPSAPVPPPLKETKYIRSDSISKSGHILRYGGLGPRRLPFFWGYTIQAITAPCEGMITSMVGDVWPATAQAEDEGAESPRRRHAASSLDPASRSGTQVRTHTCEGSGELPIV